MFHSDLDDLRASMSLSNELASRIEILYESISRYTDFYMYNYVLFITSTWSLVHHWVDKHAFIEIFIVYFFSNVCDIYIAFEARKQMLNTATSGRHNII